MTLAVSLPLMSDVRAAELKLVGNPSTFEGALNFIVSYHIACLHPKNLARRGLRRTELDKGTQTDAGEAIVKSGQQPTAYRMAHETAVIDQIVEPVLHTGPVAWRYVAFLSCMVIDISVAFAST